jgi:hypothetical protein
MIAKKNHVVVDPCNASRLVVKDTTTCQIANLFITVVPVLSFGYCVTLNLTPKITTLWYEVSSM